MKSFRFFPVRLFIFLMVFSAVQIQYGCAVEARETAEENTAFLCRDFFDNDGDGFVDCEDHDCSVFIFCIADSGADGSGNGADADVDGDGDADADADSDSGAWCLSHAYTKCYFNDVYWYDSCDVREGIAADCPDLNGECAYISPTEAECRCRNNWTGIDCNTCPGNRDPASDCIECRGNWDLETGCTTCRNHWIDENNDCGTCPGIWDESTDCKFCEGIMTGENCENACILHVNVNVDSPGDGWSWEDAFKTLQEGIDSAHSALNAQACEVWVAQGRYYVFNTGEDDSITLRTGVRLYGGFAGTEDNRDGCNWKTNRTILDGYESAEENHRVANVVTGSDDALIDGFMITNGKESGMNNHECSPTVKNCLFIGNHGGAVMNYGGCPAVSGCIFAGNMNERAGSVNCGGINNYDSSPEITDCIFSGNESKRGEPGGGGALCSELGSPAVTGCIFSGNSAEGAWGKSGAVINLKSSPDFTNCVVAGNLATAGSDAAGGMYNKWSSPEIVNCTFSGNMARVDAGVPYRGDGIYNTGDYQMESHISLKNSILWSNGNEDFNTHDVDDNIEVYINSSITGDLNAEFKGNPLLSGDTWTDISYDEDEFQTVFIDDSPWWTQDLSGMFLRPDLDDARLLYIESSTDTEIRVWGDMKTLWNLNGDEAYAIHDLHLMAISPCIDSAEDAEAPEQDIEGNDRVDVPGAGITGTVSDMGAYEYQP